PRQIGARVDRVPADVLHHLVDQRIRPLALVPVAEPLDDIGEPHDAETDGAVELVRPFRLGYRRQRDVDQVVELTYGQTGRLGKALPVDAQVGTITDEVARQVDRREVADGGVVAVLRQAD